MEKMLMSDMSPEQKIMNAISSIVTSAEFLGSAGLKETANTLLVIANQMAFQFEEELEKTEEFNNKLTNSEFDSILANILNINIEVPNGE